jgi:hypothetical protein
MPRAPHASIGRSNHWLNYSTCKSKGNSVALRQMKNKTMCGCTFHSRGVGRFWDSLLRRRFRGYFWRGMGATASPSEANEPKSNKSNARDRARPAPTLPTEVEDVLPPMILTFAEEVFSRRLCPDNCKLIFLLCFWGLASANSCAEV